MTQLSDNWFTEAFDQSGSAFSLEISEKLAEEKTEYQLIEIYQTTQWGKLMVLDGCTMVSSRDNFIYHEMMVHPALFSHPNPRHVAIIGGGDCGTLQQVLKHPEVESVTQIDIDEGVTRYSKLYFPELCTANDDPRAELLFEDGIKWMADRAEDSLDIVIIDSTDPVGPAEGLFGEQFYRSCQRALADGGIMVQQSESPIVHFQLIKDMGNAMQAAGLSHPTTLHFPQPIYPTGWWSATLAYNGEAIHEPRWQAIREHNFTTRYYNEGIHRGAFALPQFIIDLFKYS